MLAPQASISGLGTGQLQFMLSNVPQFPQGCQYQVRGPWDLGLARAGQGAKLWGAGYNSS
jgi:hypothetical protein